MLLKDRVAIVTGAAMGIGAGIALKFADEGCSIVVVDISETEGRKVVDEVKKRGREGTFIHCDVTDYSQVQEMGKQTIRVVKGTSMLLCISYKGHVKMSFMKSVFFKADMDSIVY